MSMQDALNKTTEVAQKSAQAIKDNGKAISVVTLASAIIGLVFMFEDRYALARDVNQQQQKVERLQQQSQGVVDYLKLQAQTRKTILEMKRATQGLTPAEKVELDNLKEMIKTLDKANTPN